MYLHPNGDHHERGSAEDRRRSRSAEAMGRFITGAGAAACIEVADLPDGGAAVRDSKDPTGARS
jgi:Domain of unknown function (DUF397)